MRKILVVEDDNTINELISDFLKLKGYFVMQAYSGTEALLLLAQESNISCLVLDLMLPGVNGEEIIEKIRVNNEMPIIVVSAKDKDESKLMALKLGADDFLSKPFNLEELHLKVEKNIHIYERLHNNLPMYDDAVDYKSLSLKQSTRIAKIYEKTLTLTSKEFDLLFLMVASPSVVFTKEELFHKVWHEEYCLDTSTVSVHISNLRKKMKSIDENAPSIETVWGIGFKIN